MNGKKKISLLCMGLLALTSACEKTGDSKILSRMGNNVRQETVLYPEGDIAFDLQGQQHGQYTVLLAGADGTILDTKTLFIQ